MENTLVKLNVKNVVVASLVSMFLLSLVVTSTQLGVSSVEISNVGAHLAAKLGIKLSTAGLAIDLLSGGSTVWAVIGIIFGASGAGVGVSAALFAAKAMIKKKGKDVAKAW
ncbi:MULTISPECIES: uberolysin/carnocyclin family circular bacteriocin [Heyndrickxia]|jgi:circularin A/uberolysin family circular bacteriocin|uniref:uberolysin/carnocyclin family circular bacteriocin n=1 Tax=Heyndrickxia TaxID=2837504 RepID=UPI000779AB1C|nr:MULTISPECIES: uberolysin/carnocyclin family circular bacteriocin [Heyndrickxia]MBQ4912795.1 uberolysin/carnocyclin family circular bacteriocin [Heyndrickxia faecalis]MED4978064.1 uberolysin/carnocyclin family circular bacteriocin [Weizmannia sp. CD-2023]